MNRENSRYESVPFPRFSEPETVATRDEFLHAMGRAVTGVQVVTTSGLSGRFAVTISAMSSVSADPPLLLVCINQKSPVCQAILANQIFCINVLSADQTHVSDTFSGRIRDGRPYDFGCAEWTMPSPGCPRLTGAVASFDCLLWEAHEAGSHVVFIGRTLSASDSDRKPLLYTGSSYGQPDLFVV